MKIKVCGMKNPENIQELSHLAIDYMGFIFYQKSPRYIGKLNPKTIARIPANIQKVGVFVNKSVEEIVQLVQEYNLDIVQLHGNEDPEYCKAVAEKTEKEIIKSFSISEKTDLEKTQDYKDICNYFLFDTKTLVYGGSGEKFDWDILKDYQGSTPFFLSGGISVEDAEEIKKIEHPQLFAVDINSRFELEPGLKNIHLVKEFIKNIQNNEPN